MGVNYLETIERMRWAGKLKNDSAVARVLGVTPQALSNYKKRGEMPTDLVLRFADIHGLSVDWLISGEGEMYRLGAEHDGYRMVAEEALSYGGDQMQKGCSFFGVLDPDEIILVGKLLKVMRSNDADLSSALKCTIEAFCQKVDKKEKGDNEQPQGTEKESDLVGGTQTPRTLHQT